MSDMWGELTVDDLEAMGISLEEFAAMIEGGGLGMPDYSGLGILPPIDISPQATQWDVLDAQKLAREISRPPRPYERRQDRGFFMPRPAEFSYDAVAMANPYIRALLNTAITEGGADDPFAAREYAFGRFAEGETIPEGYEAGQQRLQAAVESALPDFRYIAREFHSDDPAWATRDRDERRALLTDWLSDEIEANLAGAAPSVSRNVNFSDWALSRQGEPFGFTGPGFDRAANQPGAPRVELDPARWGPNRTEGMVAEMSANDFQRAYRDTLLRDVSDKLTAGQRFEDPEAGGYWTIATNQRVLSPLEEELRSQSRRGTQVPVLGNIRRAVRRAPIRPRNGRDRRERERQQSVEDSLTLLGLDDEYRRR